LGKFITFAMVFLGLFAALQGHEGRVAIKPAEWGTPGPNAPIFSPGILHGDTLYVSGEIGVDVHTGKIPEDFETEMKTCLANIQSILKAANMNYSNIDSVQIYLTDMDLYKRMNEVYSSVIQPPRPARVTVGVTKLAIPGTHVEISVIANK
jgi:2-iminobutanoate/2-iminopropanoate deaminase